MRIQQSLNLTILLLSFLMCFTLSTLAQGIKYPIQKVNGKNCYVYTVQQGEGLYRISKNFGVTQSEINDYNPQILDGLKVGMQIFIPGKDIPEPEVKSEVKVDKQEFIEHKVVKKQTMFAICKQYQITSEELIKHNPQIQNNKIKTGDVLKIPVVKTNNEIENITENKTLPEHKFQNQPIILPQEPRSSPYKIGFLLPFMLNQTKADQSIRKFLDFYSGAVVALNEAKRNGMSFEIYSYDTEKTESAISEILLDSMLPKMDLIIGPAFSNQVGLVSDYARIHNILTLIPFTSKIFDLDTNPWIFQFNPGKEIELNRIISLIINEYANANVVFVQLNQASANDDASILNKDLQNELKLRGRKFQTIVPSDSLSILTAVKSTSENIFFFNTSKINLAANALKQLKQSVDSDLIKIYQPISWTSTNTEKPASICVSPFKKTYLENLADYDAKFLELYGYPAENSIPRYDLIGYDLMNYFINGVFKFKNIKEKLRFPYIEGIQSDILFQRSDKKSGFINQHFEIIRSN